MSSVNKVILIGNLAAKPELKHLPSGKATAEMRIATNEKRGGEEKTEWHRVVVWEKTAENCAQYLEKGRSVYVEGRIQTRTWDDKKTGEKKYMTEIVANNVVFLGGGRGNGASSDGESRGGGYDRGRDSPPDFVPPPGEDNLPF